LRGGALVGRNGAKNRPGAASETIECTRHWLKAFVGFEGD